MATELTGTILVVDDSPLNRQLLERALTAEGHVARMATNGREALEILAAESIDVVLLDLVMPELDGYATLAAIKGNEALRHLPVIIISGVDELDSVVRCVEMGATDYLPKPFNLAILRARLHASLAGKRLRDLELAYLEQSRENERLLLNILPPAIAERLRNGEGVIADRFDDVTMLFADIVGFTELSGAMTPADVVAFLNRVFSAIDDLVDRYGLEKVKTNGDAYMVVGGIPTPVEDHVQRMADLALALVATVDRLNADAPVQARLRIGMHCGPAVAGVIGHRKFVYDVWGDTVNIASRMESLGAPGRVHVSAAVRDRLEGRYRFEARGSMDVKGKGEMATWFLLAPERVPAELP